MTKLEQAIEEAKDFKRMTVAALNVIPFKRFNESEIQGRWDAVRWVLLMANNEATEILNSWTGELK